MTSSWMSRTFSTFALSFPVVVWACDSVCSFYKVKGSSMEPCLKDGDVVLVRKADIIHFLVKDICGIFAPYDFNTREPTTEERILRIEGRPARILSRPPLALPGDVVVFSNPSTAFPSEHNIKRVIGIGCQTVRRVAPPGGIRVEPGKSWQSWADVPLFNLWVEGDNQEVSEDSNQYGPVSKKLMIGKVEGIVWPPSRWGRIESTELLKGRNRRAWWPRSFLG